MTLKESLLKADTFTSIIIDCSKFKLKRVMTPVIKTDSGMEIYPALIASEIIPNAREIADKGLVIYEKGLENAKLNKFAGKNPLIIEALGIEGIHNSEAIIEHEYANIIKKLNDNKKVLSERKVIFVD